MKKKIQTLQIIRGGSIGNKPFKTNKQAPLLPPMAELTEEEIFHRKIDEAGVLLPSGFQFERKIADEPNNKQLPLLPAGIK